MALFCLPQETIDKFKAAFSSGQLDPDKLGTASSADRRAMLEGVVGEGNAHDANSLIESKILLKDQQQGLINAAKKLAGVSGLSPEKVAEMAQLKAERLTEYMDPQQADKFLEDFAQDVVTKQYKIEPTIEQTKTITDLANRVQDSQAKADEAIKTGGFTKDTQQARNEVGANKVVLQQYVGNIKGAANTLSTSERLAPRNWGKQVNEVMSTMKQLVYSGVHAPFKQLFMAAFEDPVDWTKTFLKQFPDAVKSLAGKDVIGATKAEIFSRENSFNGMYDKYLPGELSKTNEEMQSSLFSKLNQKWTIANPFKLSKDLFDSATLKMRYDLVDHNIRIQKMLHIDPTDEVNIKAWGGLAKDFSGGTTSASKLNNFLSSRRLLNSEMNNLTMGLFDKNQTAASRLWRAKTLATAVVGIGSLIYTANKIKPGIAEIDFRGSDAGTLKLGSTRVDISGGYKGIITLATRLALAMSNGAGLTNVPTTKSSTGKLTTIGTNFGQTSPATVVGQFLLGRTSPMAQVFIDMANGQDFNGNKPSVLGELGSAFTPLPVQTYQQLKSDPNSANALAIMIANGLGIMSNTYSSSSKTQNALTPDNRSKLDQIIGIGKPKSDPALNPLIAKMVKENVSVNMPAITTTIKPQGSKTSRPMTDSELKTYTKIYQNNLIADMLRQKDNLVNLPTDKFTKSMDKIKTETTAKSKMELLRGMVK